MKRHARHLLVLVVQAQDLAAASASTRAAVAAALRAPGSPLDAVQLRIDESDDAHAVTAAARHLQALHRELPTAPEKSPKLILNAPLASIEELREEIVARGGRFAGWHVKERELPQLRERTWRREPGEVVGCSVHSVASALLAARLGLDYVQVGTMFATASHPEKTALEGPALLRAVVAAAESEQVTMPPLVAIGGISSALHIHEVLRAGASGVAVIRGILAADDPAESAAAFRATLDEA